MKRAVVSVGTTAYHHRGQDRLRSYGQFIGDAEIILRRELPPGCPPHSRVPYAFKAFALRQAVEAGARVLLWCDACMVPVSNLEPLWRRIERDGYWMSNNGWSNYEWTAGAAYSEMFREELRQMDYDGVRDINRGIKHVVAGCFGVNVNHPKGSDFLAEYYRLASSTSAFCGPWKNGPQGGGQEYYAAPCGPPDVRGHRHDQTAASVIAWRLGFELTDPPDVFAYGKLGQQPFDLRTVMLADGSYK